MDFGSFENTIDKNIETDKASDKFDQQLQAYKNAGNSLTSAKSELETAVSSLKEAKDNLDKATDKADAVTKAIDSFKRLCFGYSCRVSFIRSFLLPILSHHT